MNGRFRFSSLQLLRPRQRRLMHQDGERQRRQPGGRRIGAGAEHHRRGEAHDDARRRGAGQIFEILGQDVAGNEIGDQQDIDISGDLRDDAFLAGCDG